jgi:O-antigen/teichoic acid export membrane protein
MSTSAVISEQAAGSQGKQFSLNVISNGVVFTAGMLLNLWFIPYLIDHLGVASYGIVPLAASITTYMALMTLSLINSSGRYLSIAYNRRDFSTANEVFNSSLVMVLAASLLIAVISAVIVAYVPALFDIPAGQETAARWLFGFIALSFILNTVSSVFALSTFTHNRVDLRNTVQFITRFVRVISVVVLFNLFPDNLGFVGLGTALAALVGLGGDVYFWRRLTPEIKIHLRDFNWPRVRELFSLSSWMVIDQVGALLLRNIDLIVINVVLGAAFGGIYGPFLQITAYLGALAEVIANATIPLVMIQYAKRNFEQLRCRMEQAVRLLGLFMALPVGLLAGVARPFLGLWLGETYASYAGILVVMVVPMALQLAVRPLFPIQVAYNKVKIPGLVTLFAGMVNTVLAVILARKFGLIGVPLSVVIVITLKNVLFTTIYVAHILEQPWWLFWRSLLAPLVSTLLVSGVTYAVATITNVNTWVGLLATLALLSLVYLGAIFAFVMNDEDRALLLELIPWQALKLRLATFVK